MSRRGMQYTLKAVCNGCGASRPCATVAVPTYTGEADAALCLDCLKAGVRICSQPRTSP